MSEWDLRLENGRWSVFKRGSIELDGESELIRPTFSGLFHYQAEILVALLKSFESRLASQDAEIAALRALAEELNNVLTFDRTNIEAVIAVTTKARLLLEKAEVKDGE